MEFVLKKVENIVGKGDNSGCITLYQTTNFQTGPNWKHLQTTK